ncbi:unnamed protein product, partial [Laminaria digitata]
SRRRAVRAPLPRGGGGGRPRGCPQHSSVCEVGPVAGQAPGAGVRDPPPPVAAGVRLVPCQARGRAGAPRRLPRRQEEQGHGLGEVARVHARPGLELPKAHAALWRRPC